MQRTVRTWALRTLLLATVLALGALLAGCSDTDDSDADSDDDRADVIAAELEALKRAFPTVEKAGDVREGGIHAHGTGITTGEADVAILTLAAQARRETVTDARDDAARAMDGILGALRDAAIADGDIETARFSIQPRYEYPPNSAPRLSGYEVTNTIAVTVRDLDSLPMVIDNAVTAGGDATRIDGVRYEIEDPSALEQEARLLALEDAIAKADIYAATDRCATGQADLCRRDQPRCLLPVSRARSYGRRMPRLPRRPNCSHRSLRCASTYRQFSRLSSESRASGVGPHGATSPT